MSKKKKKKKIETIYAVILRSTYQDDLIMSPMYTSKDRAVGVAKRLQDSNMDQTQWYDYDEFELEVGSPN